MNIWLRHGVPWFLVLTLALIFAGIGKVCAQSAKAGALDPAAWGVYAKLVDSSWLHEEYQRPRRWQWDNGKIIEEFLGRDVYNERATIERGSELGKLVYTLRVDGINHQWNGEVAQDGSVLWIKKALLKQPFRVRLEGTDRLAKEWVKLRGDLVVPTRHVEMFTAMAPSAVAKFFSEESAPINQAPSADELEATAAALLDKARKQRADDQERVAGSTRPHVEAAKEPQAQVAAPDSTASAVAQPDFGIVEDMVGSLWISEPGIWTDEGSLLLTVMEVGRVKNGELMAINIWTVGHEETVFQYLYGASPDRGRVALVSTNIPGGAEWHVELVPNPNGWVRFDNYKVDRKGNPRFVSSHSWTLLADGRIEEESDGSTKYIRRIGRSQLPEVLAKVQEHEREFQRNKARSKRERSDAFWSGLSNVLQVTGAVITEHAAQTQASLDATLARAAAQEVAQRQHQAGVQARAEAQRQAAASQYTTGNADSARVDAQNQANLARMQQSLQQARQQGLDPALIASMQEAVDGVEESLRDDGGDAGYELAQQQEEDRQLRQQEQQQAEQQRQADALERQRLAEQERERAAQARREQAEQAKQKQQQALRDHLAAEQRGIRLRALTCPGGGSNYFVTGNRPSISPRVAQCISVRFEARCPATRPGQGHVEVAGNFVGGNSCVGDTRKIPALSCPAEQVVVDVLDVSTCS